MSEGPYKLSQLQIDAISSGLVGEEIKAFWVKLLEEEIQRAGEDSLESLPLIGIQEGALFSDVSTISFELGREMECMLPHGSEIFDNELRPYHEFDENSIASPVEDFEVARVCNLCRLKNCLVRRVAKAIEEEFTFVEPVGMSGRQFAYKGVDARAMKHPKNFRELLAAQNGGNRHYTLENREKRTPRQYIPSNNGILPINPVTSTDPRRSVGVEAMDGGCRILSQTATSGVGQWLHRVMAAQTRALLDHSPLDYEENALTREAISLGSNTIVRRALATIGQDEAVQTKIIETGIGFNTLINERLCRQFPEFRYFTHLPELKVELPDELKNRIPNLKQLLHNGEVPNVNEQIQELLNIIQELEGESGPKAEQDRSFYQNELRIYTSLSNILDNLTVNNLTEIIGVKSGECDKFVICAKDKDAQAVVDKVIRRIYRSNPDRRPKELILEYQTGLDLELSADVEELNELVLQNRINFAVVDYKFMFGGDANITPEEIVSADKDFVDQVQYYSEMWGKYLKSCNPKINIHDIAKRTQTIIAACSVPVFWRRDRVEDRSGRSISFANLSANLSELRYFLEFVANPMRINIVQTNPDYRPIPPDTHLSSIPPNNRLAEKLTKRAIQVLAQPNRIRR